MISSRFFFLHVCLLLCTSLISFRGATGQESESGSSETSPPSSVDSEVKVAEFLAQVPPSGGDGSPVGLLVFSADRFSAGHQLAYFVASCACLCLLVPGAYMIYTSCQGIELSQERIGQAVLTLCLLSLTWVSFVYSIGFARNAHSYDIQRREIHLLDPETAPGNLYIGDFGHVGFQGLLSEWGAGLVRHPVRRPGDPIPHSLFMTFQMMLFLQAIVPLLAVSTGRLNIWSSIPLWLIWSASVYAPLCYWTRGGGWLADSVDAGATVPAHIGVGFTALGLWFFGLRQTQVTFTSVQRGPLIVGSVLFLAGSLMVAACRSVSHAPWPTLDFLNVFLGGVSGVLLWLLFAQRSTRLVPTDWPLGMIAGIVSVSAGCASMPPTSAIVVSVLTVFACCLTLSFVAPKQSILSIIFAIYGVSGFVGLLLAGVFSSPEIGGSDRAGKPIVGLIAGDVELLRVQFLTAVVAATVAFLSGLILPSIARAIGFILERLFTRKSNVVDPSV